MSTSSILYLLNLSDAEEEIAIGLDRVALVRSNRRTAMKQRIAIEKLLEDETDSMTSLRNPAKSFSMTTIFSGGGFCGTNRVLITYRTIGVQTDSLDGTFAPISEYFFHDNEGILDATPRDIQLARPIYLADIDRPGNRFREGRFSQTLVTISRPDLWPLTTAVSILEGSSKNVPHKIKLNYWTPDKMKFVKKYEKDSEWLKLSSSFDSELDAKENAEWLHRKKEAWELESYSDRLLESISMLLFFMQLGGRWPLTLRQVNNSWRFHLKKFSLNYIFFAFTSIVYFYIAGTSVFNTLAFVFAAGSAKANFSQTIYLQVERLDFDKYWHYVFWSQIVAMYVCFWNVALLLEDWIPIQDLLNRWLFTVKQIHYIPTLGVRNRILLSILGFVLYVIALTTFCFTTYVPAVRGTAGVIGTLIFDRIFPKIRFSSNFYLVRTFGLVFHLYTVYAAQASLLLIVITTKILENAAKNWNLRFAIRFRMLRKRVGNELHKIVVHRSDIPIPKLLLEHRLITSFSRHTADIFHATLNIYLLTKGTEMTLFLYRSFAFILIADQHRFNETVTSQKIGASGDTIAYKDSEAQRQLSCFFVTGFIVIGWFVNSRYIADCGEAILNGSKFVTRYGLIVCRNAKERNFIQSLNTQFAPVLEYGLKTGGVMYNRRFILSTFLWILIFALGLLSFFPFNLQKSTISYCGTGVTGEIECQTVHVSRSQRRRSGQTPEVLVIPTKSPKIDLGFLRNITCPGTTSLDENGTIVETTVLTLVGCDGNGQVVNPFSEYNLAPCFKNFDLYLGATPNERNSQPYPRRKELYDCNDISRRINLTDRDDCGNLRFGDKTKLVPSKRITFQDPITRQITLGFVCCFKYFGISGEEASFLPCHAQHPEQIFYACKQKSKSRIEDLPCYVSSGATSMRVTKTPKKTTTLSTTTATRATTTTKRATTIKSSTTTTLPTTTTTLATITTPTTTKTTVTTKASTTTTTLAAITTPTTTTTAVTTKASTTTTKPTTTTTMSTTKRTSTTALTTTTLKPECLTTWIDIRFNVVKTKVLTSELNDACDSSGTKRILPYKNGYCAESPYAQSYSSVSRNSLYSCSSPGQRITDFDDCGNIRVGNPEKKLISILYYEQSKPGIGAFTLICAYCYNYRSFGHRNTKSLSYCHMQSSEQADVACKGPTATRSAKFQHFSTDISSTLNCPPTEPPPNATFSCPVDPLWVALVRSEPVKTLKIQPFVLVIAACKVEEGTGKFHRKPPFKGTQDCFSPSEQPILGVRPSSQPYSSNSDRLVSCLHTSPIPIEKMKRDSCGNLPHAVAGIVKLVPIYLKIEASRWGLACCYDYTFLKENNKISLQYCHQNSADQAKAACAWIRTDYVVSPPTIDPTTCDSMNKNN